MTVASAAAAEFMWRSGLPLVYTNHSWGAGAEFDLEPSGHEGLNLPVYARVTAPLRRMEDRINLACLLAASLAEPAPFSRAQMQELVDRRRCVVPAPAAAEDQMGLAAHLAGLARADFFYALESAALSGRWPVALQEEFLYRAGDGRLEERDLVQAFANGAAPAPEALRLAAVAALRGADEGEHVAGAVAYLGGLLGIPPPLMQAPEAYPDGYIMDVVWGDERDRGMGSIPRLARRDALGRLLARRAGVDPDAASDPSARVLLAPAAVLGHFAMEQGSAQALYKFETVRGGFRAAVHVPGYPGSFRGQGRSKKDARNAAAEAALAALFGVEAEAAPVPRMLQPEPLPAFSP